MAATQGVELLAPEFRLRIGGRPLPARSAGDLISATVEEDVDAAGMFTCRFVNWDIDKLEVTWSDDETVALGNEVAVQMGYTNALETLITGDITSIEPDFVNGRAPTVTVRGYDRRYKLMRGRKTRSFNDRKDSDVASTIAFEAGLSAQCEDSSVEHAYVLQHDQTDYEFLVARARRIGYEVLVDDRTLLFRPRKIDQKPVLTLRRDQDLIEFYPRLAGLDQIEDLEVRAWNPADKKTIVSRARTGDESAAMGGSTGPESAGKAFGKASSAVVELPLRTQAAADQFARGLFDGLALNYILGEGVAAGRTDLRAGAVIQLEDLGRRFSGAYYVTSTVHSWTPRRGYRTAFHVRRNAS